MATQKVTQPKLRVIDIDDVNPIVNRKAESEVIRITNNGIFLNKHFVDTQIAPLKYTKAVIVTHVPGDDDEEGDAELLLGFYKTLEDIPSQLRESSYAIQNAAGSKSSTIACKNLTDKFEPRTSGKGLKSGNVYSDDKVMIAGTPFIILNVNEKHQ